MDPRFAKRLLGRGRGLVAFVATSAASALARAPAPRSTRDAVEQVRIDREKHDGETA